MAKPLSPRQREHLFKIYQDHPSLRGVALASGRAHSTVKKYFLLDRWEERLNLLQKQAQELADAFEVRRLSDALRDVVPIRDTLLRLLRSALDSGDFSPSVSDVDRLLRLEAFLRGQPDTRSEQWTDPLSSLILALREFDAQEVSP